MTNPLVQGSLFIGYFNYHICVSFELKTIIKVII